MTSTVQICVFVGIFVEVVKYGHVLLDPNLHSTCMILHAIKRSALWRFRSSKLDWGVLGFTRILCWCGASFDPPPPSLLLPLPLSSPSPLLSLPPPCCPCRTHRNLHSHTEKAPMTPSHYQVTCYGEVRQLPDQLTSASDPYLLSHLSVYLPSWHLMVAVSRKGP